MSRGAKPTTRRSPALGGRELRARVSAGEYRQVQAAAEAEGMTVPAYVRTAALSGRYRALLSTVMAEVEPVELERPLPVAEVVEERSCFTCKYDHHRPGLAAHWCSADSGTDPRFGLYMVKSGALGTDDLMPTNRTVRCPGWAAKESK